MNSSRQPQAYIFDYGGTLDTGGRHWGRVIWQAWQEAGVPVGEEQFRQAYVAAERRMAAEPLIQPDYTFRQTLDVKLRLELTSVGADAYRPQVLESLYAQTVRHTQHSREVLSALAANSPLVLVSNFYGNLSAVLREFRLDGLFRSVVESAVVGLRKPDPRIFLKGVESLGLLPAQVAVVGDSISNDILPARQAGCLAVWLRGQQWTDAPVDESAPHRIINDLEELLPPPSPPQGRDV